MKLAEALIIRADLQKKFASLRERVGVNCKVQEGSRLAKILKSYSRTRLAFSKNSKRSSCVSIMRI